MDDDAAADDTADYWALKWSDSSGLILQYWYMFIEF